VLLDVLVAIMVMTILVVHVDGIMAPEEEEHGIVAPGEGDRPAESRSREP